MYGVCTSLLTQVYIPLPRPIGYDTADEYKIMLSFDRACAVPDTHCHLLLPPPDDRQLSTWLPVISKRIKFFPMVELVLTRTGPHLTKVSAKVLTVQLPLNPLPDHA